MVKRIGRRFVSLLLTFVTILSLLPAMTLPAMAASSKGTLSLADKKIGLEYSGNEEGQDNNTPWYIDGADIIGSALTRKPCGSDITSYNSTLTITNNMGADAVLSFSYTIVDSVGEIKVDNTSVTANGTLSKKLSAGEEVTVYINSGSAVDDKVTIRLSNLLLVRDVQAETIFVPAENGSYTVNGQEITGTYTNTQHAAKSYQVVATPAAGYKFRDWYNVKEGTRISTKSSDSLNIEADCTITARFVPKNTATFDVVDATFTDLGAAVEYATQNKKDTITLLESGSLLAGEYMIPAGVTLLIPFDEAGTVYTNEPRYVGAAETQTAYKTLTMPSGSSIKVYGAISVGGKHFAGSSGSCCKTTGRYGQIIMQEGSSITLYNGANLYAWGYITGDGKITATSGSTVYEYFQVTDWRGGNATLKMNGNDQKVFPFSQYYVQNIEAPLTIQNGATEKTHFSVNAMRKTYSATIDFIGTNGLFKLESGSITKKYVPATGRTEYTTNGTASLDKLSVTVGSFASIHSNDYALPINGNMTLNIASGKVTSNHDLCLLPDVQINIAKDAELVVAENASLYVYDSEQWGTYCYSQKKLLDVNYSPTPNWHVRKEADLVDAKIDLNGKLTAIGSVYTTQSGADICSSGGTGKFIQQSAPGTAAVTHQVEKQVNTGSGLTAKVEITYADIPITAAKLKNASADKPYTETSTAKAGETFTYCKCQDCGNGTWVKDIAAIINNGTQGDTYSTLEAAVNPYTPNSSTAPTNYIKLLHNTTEKTISVNNKSLYLDLNGRTVTGDISVTSGYKLYGMDSSAKADYTTAPTGKIVGTVKGCAPTYQTPGDTYDCYVAIPGTEADNETANLSFHRFNISVTGYRFELAAPQCALFFIGKFQGDAEAKNHLTKLGFTLKDKKGNQLGEANYEFTAGTVFPPMPNEGEASDSKVVCSGDAYLFEAYLMRSFKKDKPNDYTEQIDATAQATFNNGGTQDSEPKQWSFKDAWTETDGLKDLTSEQLEILNKFLTDLGINP